MMANCSLWSAIDLTYLNPTLSLTIIVRGLQLSLCIHGEEKMLVDVEEHSSPFSASSIHMHLCPWIPWRAHDTPRHSWSWIYHTCSLDKLYPGFFKWTWSSNFCDNWSSVNHLLIKIHVSIMYRWDMCNLLMAPNHIGQWNPAHPSDKLEVQHYVLHNFCPMILINFGCLSVICFLLFQLPLMLVLQHRCVVDILNVLCLGAAFHQLES